MKDCTFDKIKQRKASVCCFQPTTPPAPGSRSVTSPHTWVILIEFYRRREPQKKNTQTEISRQLKITRFVKFPIFSHAVAGRLLAGWPDPKFHRCVAAGHERRGGGPFTSSLRRGICQPRPRDGSWWQGWWDWAKIVMEFRHRRSSDGSRCSFWSSGPGPAIRASGVRFPGELRVQEEREKKEKRLISVERVICHRILGRRPRAVHGPELDTN